MTRLAHYQLYSCPLCETVYKHPLWASVSIYVPQSVNPYLPRVCQKCGFQSPLDRWTEAGIVERYTPEELERRGALAMHMFGAGPPPPKLPPLQRIKEAIFGKPEPIDPSAAYPEIVITEKDEKPAPGG